MDSNRDKTLRNLLKILLPLKLIGLLLIFSISAFGQIEVHDEPMHHPVLQNKIARVLDVIAQPGDTSLLHQHANNYCYVTVQGGTVWLESPGEKERVVELPVGYIGGYYENPSKPLVHRFANLSNNTIRLIAIENLSTPGHATDSIVTYFQREEVIINNPYFLVTKMPISANGFLEIRSNKSCVIVNLESKKLYSGKQKKTPLKQWVWLDANKSLFIHNRLNDDAWIVVVNVKSEK